MDASQPSISGGAYLRLVGLAAAIGVPAALVAALFLALVHGLEHWLWHDLPDTLGYSGPPWFLVLGLPVAGAAIVVVARRLLPGDGGHSPLEGMVTAPTPVSYAPGVLLAALGTLGFGAVLGPEAPVIALGSVVGMVVMAIRPMGARETALVSSAGSTSAISALFGGPLVAGVLLVEGGVGLGEALLPALLPGLVAAAVGYVIFLGFGDWGGLNAPGLVVPNLPAYNGTHLYDLGVGVVVGVLAAFVVVAAHPLGERIGALTARYGMPSVLLGGGLAVGAIAELGDLLGANSQDILFSGQSSIPTVVGADSTRIVVILVVAKFLAYGVSLGCGFRGGAIFPAVFLGVALSTLAVVWFDVSPTLAIAVGAAAGMAAQTGLLISPLLFGELLVGSAGTDAVSAAVLAVAAAWITSRALGARTHHSHAPAAAASR